MTPIRRKRIQIRGIVQGVGFRPFVYRTARSCCKACQSSGIPMNMMQDLLSTVHEEEADILCMICPTCFGQFDHGQKTVAKKFDEDFHTPPVYYFQLLALAQGVPYDDLGLERQRFKPDCLRELAAGDLAGAPPQNV